jgi:outer membrane lipoprotein-sorting protein
MSRTERVAAGILALGAVAVCIFLALAAIGDRLSYDDVAQRIGGIQRMSFTEVDTLSYGGATKTTVRRMSFMEPDKVRVMSADGKVVVTDRTTARGVRMDPISHKASFFASPEPGSDRIVAQAAGGDADATMIDEFRRLAEMQGKAAGERWMLGLEARMFSVKEAGAMVLVNPDTGLPLAVEYRELPGGRSITLCDFVFDQSVAADLFSLEPPAGYTVEEPGLLTGQDLSGGAGALSMADGRIRGFGMR